MMFILVCLLAAFLFPILYLISTKPRPINGLVCVVTGGAGAIGQSVSKILLEKGAIVVVWDVCKKNIAAMKKSLGSKHSNLHFFEVDVSSIQQVEFSAERLIEQLGRVDILINQAGLSNPFDIEESSPEDIQRILNVNFLSYIWTIRTFLPYLKKSPAYNGLTGSVVGMSSILGSVGTGGLQMYCSSKAAIIGLMESLYMQHTDVHWCIVTPFLVNTDLFKGMRHRYINYFYPMLEKEEVAKQLVDGILYQRSYVTIPWFWNYSFCLVKNLFPLWVLKFLEDVFDVRLAYLQHHRRITSS